MGADVLIKDGLLAELFATFRARKWLLTTMNSDVLVQYGTLPKAAWTVGASERFFVGVYPEVLRKV